MFSLVDNVISKWLYQFVLLLTEYRSLSFCGSLLTLGTIYFFSESHAGVIVAFP